MEALAAAAEAALEDVEDGGPGVHNDDREAERGDLPSDDEEGPHDPDEDADALPPGNVDAAGDHFEDEDVAREEAGQEETGAAGSCPPLPESLSSMKVEEFKEQLRWRGLAVGGNKAELKARLEQAISDGVAVLETLTDRAGRAAAAQATESSRWEALDASKIDRPVYTGRDKFVPKAELGFTPTTHPFEYMEAYYPAAIRDLEVDNSNRYRHHLAANYTEIYPTAKKIDVKTNSLAHAMLICQGLSPVPTQRTIFRRSFAYKGHRGADLMTKSRWLEWKAFFHISHPGQAPAYGTAVWDELYKVRPLLDAYLEACVNNIEAGRKFSIDEITIGFQGHHARLKLRCGKFKRTGDGFQADAIVLEGGYVLFMVFRGDNTMPVFEKSFSPLHNRCLLLLSKLLLDGHTGWWDNLYPSLPVVQAVARGGQYTARIPAGSRAGASQTITVPRTGTSGTARVNRGVPTQCKQPNPKADKISQKRLEEIKAKPLEERMKSAMTTSEPRVLCVSVFDNGPVHMLDTIHTSAGVITIHKPRWDPENKRKTAKAIRLCNVIHAYNHGMDYVDVRDHLGHDYNFDGSFWRDRKWWMPIFKEIFKSACDQGYVVYKRVCEIAEEKRQKEVADAANAGRGRRGRGRGRSPATAPQTVRTKPIKPISHLDFLEKIAEGYVIEAYNSTKSNDADRISLRAYNLDMLEQALSEMRGDAAPTEGAQGAAAAAQLGGAAGGKAVKRRLTVRRMPRSKAQRSIAAPLTSHTCEPRVRAGGA